MFLHHDVGFKENIFFHRSDRNGWISDIKNKSCGSITGDFLTKKNVVVNVLLPPDC